MTAPTSQPDFPSESRSQPDRRRQNGRFKTPVADHPQWRYHLDSRRILEPVIEASIEVEHDPKTGQDVLVWREKRRDGSPGKTRRRLLKQVTVISEEQAKVRWQFKGPLQGEKFHFIGKRDDLKRASDDAGAVLNIVEGEFDDWSMHPVGNPNTVGIYGISNIP